MWNWILKIFGLEKREAANVIPFPAPSIPIPVNIPPAVSGEYRADWPKPEWTEFLSKALDELGRDLLNSDPRDAEAFAPNFKKIDRKRFWIALLSCLPRYESNFKPETSYKEGFSDKYGEPVISMGLFQVSKESANGNYGAGIKDAKELYDPEINIRVAVRIFNKLVVRDGIISGASKKGAGAYWSVIQPGHRNQKIAAIQKRVKELCGS